MQIPAWVNDVLVVSGAEQLAHVEKRRDSQTLAVAYPVVDGDISVLEQVLQVLRDESFPAQWHLLLDMSAFEGYERFEHIEAFAGAWTKLVAGAGDDRRIAVVSKDPLMAARFGTGSYQTPFGTHACVLFGEAADAAAWIASSRG